MFQDVSKVSSFAWPSLKTGASVQSVQPVSRLEDVQWASYLNEDWP
jgi:hypothetical protein